ncbi:DUF6283 family protein [uncultured Deinococcus sp.]|uniref:DUF6283 family protein n=1 Tax=uncultured Deinococcus sp. TaxID=158789 RepID=UPI00258520B7|nr:DUF6283 family protein [uncultured Deinococcus sp.]
MKDHQPLRSNEDITAVLSLRRPCQDCPFRRDVPSYLSAGWAEQTIAAQDEGVPFFCHRTTTKTGYATSDRRARYCAGSLLYGEAVHRHILPVRLAIHLGLYDPSRLDHSVPVLDSPEALREHHRDAV